MSQTGADGESGRAGAVVAFARCAFVTGWLLSRRKIRLSSRHVSWQLTFADGVTGRVYRETVNHAPSQSGSCLLIVTFVLRVLGQSRLLHALFRAESILNTPLFAGFPGFRSKLWLTDTNTGVYRGVYEWDGADRADSYARTLSRLLRPLSRAGSVRFHVVDGVTPAEVLADPAVLVASGSTSDELNDPWWRIDSVSAS